MAMIKFKNNNSGFTLVEAIASAFIFSLIVVILIAMFVFALNIQRQALSTQYVVENTNYIMESMAKEIRMALEFTRPLTNDCFEPTLADPLEIRHPMNADKAGVSNGSVDGRIVYYYDAPNFNLHRKVYDTTGSGKSIDTILNSDTVKFTRFQVCTQGITVADVEQPRITIIAKIESKSNSLYTFNIQTTISMRNEE